jgi:hypothetical protein
MDGWDWEMDQWNAVSSAPILSQITKLRLSELSFSDSHILVAFLCSFPQLEKLYLDCVELQNHEIAVPEGLHISSKLDTLRMTTPDFFCVNFLLWLSRSDPFPPIQRVYIGDLVYEEMEALDQLLQQIGGTLRHLSVAKSCFNDEKLREWQSCIMLFYHPYIVHVDLLYRHINLSRHPQLDTLELDFCYFTVGDTLSELLSDCPPSLRLLAIDVMYPVFADDDIKTSRFMWDPFERMVSSARLPRLQKVFIRFDPSDDNDISLQHETTIWNRLPSCHARNILHIENTHISRNRVECNWESPSVV